MIKLYDVNTVAGMMGLSTSCVYKKAERGEIQSVKIGSALRFSESDIEAFLEICRTQKQPPKRQISNQNIDCDSLDIQDLR
jgi:excisionase family DNA binding protein